MIYTAEQKPIAIVRRFFPRISVIAITPTETLKIGDKIRITGKGGEVNIEQTITSMQKDHNPIKEAKPGDLIGIQVSEVAPVGCCVFKV